MRILKKNLNNSGFEMLKVFLILLIILCVTVGFRKNERKPISRFCPPNYCLDYNRILTNGMSVNAIDTTAQKVMIVAHPDDETLWGSSALYHDKYLVVCITCGERKDRVKEFEKVMLLTNDDYIMLGYPDLVKGKKSDWSKEWDAINRDIQTILNAKNWDVIVTHNPDGEYGHIHHKMTNKIVTSHADHDRLTYFGRFYWGKIPNKDTLYRLTEDEFAFKKNVLISEYKTQVKAIDNLKNMVHYESWVTYKDWYGETGE